MNRLGVNANSVRIIAIALTLAQAFSVEAGSITFQFEPLGPLPPDVQYFGFQVSNISPNGCSIAGDYSMSGRIVQGAWTFGDGFVPLEIPASYPEFRRTSLNSAINDNGLIAGRFVWRYDTQEQAYKYVQELSSIFTNATYKGAQAVAVSHDGSILGGWSRNDDINFFGDYAATIWHPENPADPTSLYVPEELLPLPGHDESAIQDMSSDGTVVVGFSVNNGAPGGYNPQAVRWAPSDSLLAHPLPTPTPPQLGNVYVLVSPNGRETVVSRCFATGSYETCIVFLNFSNGTTIMLDDVGRPSAVSDNHVALGETVKERSRIIWASYLGGSRSLSEILTHAGFTQAEATAWLEWSTFDISADGRTLLGSGVDPVSSARGLIKIQLPLPGDADDNERVNLTDFAVLKNAFGQNGTALPTDFDFNSVIDDSDFTILQSHFGKQGLSPSLGTCFPG